MCDSYLAKGMCCSSKAGRIELMMESGESISATVSVGSEVGTGDRGGSVCVCMYVFVCVCVSV